MAVRIAPNSILRFSDLLIVDDVEFWTLPERIDIEEQEDDVQYRVLPFDRLDLLALRFYGDVNLWWVIAVANGLEILPTDLTPGLVIRIPSKTYVDNTLFQRVRG